jgi:hypothetical protein
MAPSGTTSEKSRQEALSDLLAQAEQTPEVAEAMRAYEDLQESLAFQVVIAEGEIRSATGGNAP